MDQYQVPDLPDTNSPTIFLAVSVTILLTICICKFFDLCFSYTIPLKLPTIMISIAFGVVARCIPDLAEIRQVRFEAINMLAFYLPLYCLRTALLLDKKKIFKFASVILILSFVPLISGLLHGYIMLAIHDQSWTHLEVILFGILFGTTYPYFLISSLKHSKNLKDSHYLFQGEATLSIMWYFYTINLILDVMAGKINSWMSGLWFFFEKMFFGSLLGYVLGKIVIMSFVMVVFDLISTIVFLVCAMFVAFAAGNVLQISEYTTTAVVGLVIFTERHRFSSFNEQNIITVVEIVYSIVDIALFSYCIFHIVILMDMVDIGTLYLYFFNYASILLSRGFTLIIIYPLLRLCNKSITFSKVMVLIWGNCVGNFPLILTIYLYNINSTNRVGRELISYMLFQTLLTTIINNACVSALMTFINVTYFTSARVNSALNILRRIYIDREKLINSLKSKKIMADVDWSMVRKLTHLKLPSPYPPKLGHAVETNVENRAIPQCCVTCPNNMIPVMSAKKMLFLTREAKKLVFGEIKSLVIRYNKYGFLSVECRDSVIKLMETYASDDNENQSNKYNKILTNYFKRSAALVKISNIYHKVFKLRKDTVRVPRKKYRRICYFIVMNEWFQSFIYFTIIASTALIFLRNKVGVEHLGIYGKVSLLLIFSFEFIATVLAYSFLRISEGFKMYFRSHWHIIDFICLVFLILEVVILIYVKLFTEAKADDRGVVNIISYLTVARSLRLLQVSSKLIPKLLQLLEREEQKRIMFGYELNRALNLCLHDVLLILDRIIENKEIRENIGQSLKQFNEEIFNIVREVGRDIPWVCTTYETKMVLGVSQFAMNEALQTLKMSGFVDVVEYQLITKAIKQNDLNNLMLTKIPPISVAMKLAGINWLYDDKPSIDYLRGVVVIRTYPANEVICQAGEFLEGVHVILSGVIKLRYLPNTAITTRVVQNGQLPIVDFMNATEYESPLENYMQPGCSIGELSLLTGRAYDCTLTAETDVKTYFIETFYVKQLINRKPDPFTGLKSKLWKHVATKTAMAALMNCAIHQLSTPNDISLKLERAFVPNICSYKIFVVTEMIEDVILLQGMVKDLYGDDVYKAPCFLPRSLKKICLPAASKVKKNKNLEAKLMVIPTLGSDIYLVMEREEEVAELMVECDYESLIQNTPLRKRRLHRKQIMKKLDVQLLL